MFPAIAFFQHKSLETKSLLDTKLKYKKRFDYGNKIFGRSITLYAESDHGCV